MKPPLALHALVIDSDGTTARWDPASPHAGDRPLDLSFSTKRGEGFSSSTCRLPRRIDQDYPDLGLLDDFTLVGEDGSTAYEGRIAAQPRSYDGGHSISVQTVGHMAHARDRKFTQVYVDRDLSRWGPISNALRATLLAGGYSPSNDATVRPDTTTNLPALITGWQGAWNGKPYSGALYDSGTGNEVGAVYYDFLEDGALTPTDTGWEMYLYSRPNDNLTGTGGVTSNLRAASGSGYFTPSTPARFAAIEHYYNTAGAAGVDQTEYTVSWRNLAVYGNHGLTRQGTDPGGFVASDVITHIVQNWCPQLNAGGVQDTTYPIAHLAFTDRTAPYDAFLECNKVHLWELAVWEDKTLHFYPSDLTDYDWEVRFSDPGVDIDLQGDSSEDLANGIVVEFDDVTTGLRNTLTPDDTPALADTSVENPANAHGLEVWTEISLSSPTTPDMAEEIGRIALAEFNSPKAPGTIKVTGHVKDRAGNWQQGWKVRAGETVAITDHPNDRPRLIHETQWDNDAKTLTLAVEGPLRRADAIFDRFGVALRAAGLAA